MRATWLLCLAPCVALGAARAEDRYQIPGRVRGTTAFARAPRDHPRQPLVGPTAKTGLSVENLEVTETRIAANKTYRMMGHHPSVTYVSRGRGFTVEDSKRRPITVGTTVYSPPNSPLEILANSDMVVVRFAWHEDCPPARTLQHTNAAAAMRKANPSYPTWFRGNGAHGHADDSSQYSYTVLAGNGAASGISPRRFLFGTLTLMPGRTYPAHNHPAFEVYYVVSGEAEWYVDDERRTVGPGAAILHRSLAAHGWVATSKEPLRAVWAWWVEGEQDPSVLDHGARFTNPLSASDAGTASPVASPVPRPHE